MTLLARARSWARLVKRDGVTLWFAARHPRTPWYAKALGAAVVAYALSPIDLIPDVIPVLGYLDELILLPLLVALAVRLLPADVLAECRRDAEAWMASAAGKPRSWVGAVVIVVIWLLAASLLLAWAWPVLTR